MLFEIAKPVTFICCIVALYALFYAAFLNPADNLEQRVYDSLGLLVLAAAESLISGLIFREAAHNRPTRLAATLPVQMFCWASAAMLLLFVVSWYWESHCMFRQDARFWT